jgi:hypothetical protein
MTDEALDAELEALGAPLTTAPSYQDDDRFDEAVEKLAVLLANEQTAKLRRERHELQKALAAAEARAKPSRCAPVARGLPGLDRVASLGVDRPRLVGREPLDLPGDDPSAPVPGDG